MIILGFTQGMQPIIGYNYGAKLMHRVTKTLKMTIAWATGISIFGFLIANILPHELARAFTTDETLIKITASGMRIYMIVFPLVGFQIVTSNFFQSIGKAKIAIFLSLTRQMLFLAPLILWLPTKLSLTGVWAAQPISDFLTFIVTATTLIAFYAKIKKQNTLSQTPSIGNS
jgi:Na+-driven multidrug efflux pump